MRRIIVRLVVEVADEANVEDVVDVIVARTKCSDELAQLGLTNLDGYSWKPETACLRERAGK